MENPMPTEPPAAPIKKVLSLKPKVATVAATAVPTQALPTTPPSKITLSGLKKRVVVNVVDLKKPSEQSRLPAWAQPAPKVKRKCQPKKAKPAPPPCKLTPEEKVVKRERRLARRTAMRAKLELLKYECQVLGVAVPSKNSPKKHLWKLVSKRLHGKAEERGS
jgi:hypothetical protein